MNPIRMPPPAAKECRLLIVEGEVSADAALDLKFGNLAVACWKGGSKQQHMTDWQKLAGNGWREIVLWPDNDTPGRLTMAWIGRKLQELGAAGVKLVDSAALELPEGGDIADMPVRTNPGRQKIEKILDAAAPFTDPDAAVLQNFADIEPEPVDWIIPGWLARGEITLLAGEAGKGKSTLSLMVAALISTGRDWFDGAPIDRAEVLVYSSEDSPEHTISPALKAARSDRLRVKFIKGIPDPNRPGEFLPFDPSEHLPHLANAIKERGGKVAAVILDPVKDISRKVRDEFREGDIRKALHPLQALAARENVAVLGITHYGKAHNTKGSGPVDRMLGSQAWGAVARTIWALGKDHMDRLALMRVKSNLGPTAGGFRLAIDGVNLGDGIETKRIRLIGPVDGEAEDVFRPPATEQDQAEAPRREMAEEFILAMLADGSARKWEEIEAGGTADGHTAATMKKARIRLRKAKKIEMDFARERDPRWRISQ